MKLVITIHNMYKVFLSHSLVTQSSIYIYKTEYIYKRKKMFEIFHAHFCLSRIYTYIRAFIGFRLCVCVLQTHKGHFSALWIIIRACDSNLSAGDISTVFYCVSINVIHPGIFVHIHSGISYIFPKNFPKLEKSFIYPSHTHTHIHIRSQTVCERKATNFPWVFPSSTR